MKPVILAFAAFLPAVAQASSDFSTKDECMTRLEREISYRQAIANRGDFWASTFAPARTQAPDAVDRLVEIKGEIAALQSELVDQLMMVCASYD